MPSTVTIVPWHDRSLTPSARECHMPPGVSSPWPIAREPPATVGAATLLHSCATGAPHLEAGMSDPPSSWPRGR